MKRRSVLCLSLIAGWMLLPPAVVSAQQPLGPREESLYIGRECGVSGEFVYALVGDPSPPEEGWPEIGWLESWCEQNCCPENDPPCPDEHDCSELEYSQFEPEGTQITGPEHDTKRTGALPSNMWELRVRYRICGGCHHGETFLVRGHGCTYQQALCEAHHTAMMVKDIKGCCSICRVHICVVQRPPCCQPAPRKCRWRLFRR
ncbi:MAG: hypothetical protein KatS3mg105_5186 [Gemmatales bacterium]|nr:MAG: hypothetical protein KatS3mg105_5186 [Gemmatales bacterium]